MHPYIHELADRQGMLIWSEIPVYAMKTHVLAKTKVRKLAAQEMRRNVEANLNHPSVLLWSVANELSSRPGPVQGDYIRRAARIAKDIDPTRPVGIAFAGYLSSGCHSEYAPLDVLGVNDYFGWYPGPGGQIFDRHRLSGYLDSVRRCYPRHAIMVSEFGAEANRDGPVEEKGTWGFQQEWINFHLGVFASKPWLSGALYWALNEFRVKPDWEGGNPRP
jgi:beta-glucuronidase